MHEHALRVYYEDTDAGGVVYYAGYLRFLERARSEWLRTFGIGQKTLLGQGVAFAVRRMEAHYHRPAHLDDCLVVRSQLIQRRRVALTFAQEVLRAEQTLCSAQTEVVCVDTIHFRPMALPTSLDNA